MNPRAPTTDLFAIVAIACLATLTIGDRMGDVTTSHHLRLDHKQPVQLLCHFGTGTLSIKCSPSHCLVILSSDRPGVAKLD